MIVPQQTQVNPYAGPHAESTYTYAVSAKPQVSIVTESGGIIIKRGDAGKIVVTVNRRAKTQAALATLAPRVSESENAVSAAAKMPAHCDEACSVDFIVTVPEDTSVVATADNGEIRINDVGGSVTAATKSGDILCGGLGGNVTLGSESGRLNAGFADLTHVSKITLGTQTGPLRVVLPHGATVGTVKLGTANGTIYAPWQLQTVAKGPGVSVTQQLSSSGPDIAMGTTNGNINIVIEP